MAERASPRGTLHVYGPRQWHSPAFLIGTDEALLRLARTILALFDDQHIHGTCAFWAGDGEGYTLEIRRAEEVALALHYAAPYTDEIAREARPEAHWPQKGEA